MRERVLGLYKDYEGNADRIYSGLYSRTTSIEGDTFYLQHRSATELGPKDKHLTDREVL